MSSQPITLHKGKTVTQTPMANSQPSSDSTNVSTSRNDGAEPVTVQETGPNPNSNPNHNWISRLWQPEYSIKTITSQSSNAEKE